MLSMNADSIQANADKLWIVNLRRMDFSRILLPYGETCYNDSCMLMLPVDFDMEQLHHAPFIESTYVFNVPYNFTNQSELIQKEYFEHIFRQAAQDFIIEREQTKSKHSIFTTWNDVIFFSDKIFEKYRFKHISQPISYLKTHIADGYTIISVDQAEHIELDDDEFSL